MPFAPISVFPLDFDENEIDVDENEIDVDENEINVDENEIDIDDNEIDVDDISEGESHFVINGSSDLLD